MSLKTAEIDLNIYSNGKSIKELCPERLKDDWETVINLMKAYFASLKEAKVSFEENDIFSFIPERITQDYNNLKLQISEHIIQTYERPDNYDLLSSVMGLVNKIKKQKLDVRLESLREQMHSYTGRRFYKKMKTTSPYIKYNVFGTKTGRLSTTPGSFPILTMNKEYRGIIKPTNGYFVELDFNAAELRTLLALSGQEQPEEDLHEWNGKHVYRGLQDREEAKKRIFAWLYNPESKDYLSERFYRKESVKENYYDGEFVINPFGRKIESDEFHAVNYIIQSTASDLFLKQVLKIDELLEDKKSFISFMIHDSFVIDFHKDDKALLKDVVKMFSDTEFGKFKTSLKVGTDFGNMVVLGE